MIGGGGESSHHHRLITRVARICKHHNNNNSRQLQTAAPVAAPPPPGCCFHHNHTLVAAAAARFPPTRHSFRQLPSSLLCPSLSRTYASVESSKGNTTTTTTGVYSNKSSTFLPRFASSLRKMCAKKSFDDVVYPKLEPRETGMLKV